ncbi:pyridoxal phosphatase [Hafnia alvei]|uniref:Pyridoxal phosphatase n=1 Tax=Hafnia alvei TaxID=569 RepID=A0ABD7QAF3_HAFAL|nr:pyridoxal phosphatase [Hafnia alvei]KAA0261952.1 pyridoxal phosphatase [Hafnia alvei]TBL69467.1 pyridoxal phosphatase [Hafnia alvei]
MSYRMIALDLDGTLLTSRKQILPESLAALDLARKAGLEVMIVTGRHHIAIHPFYQALNLNTPAICCNGTYLYDYQARSVLASNPLTAEQAHQVLERLNDADIHGLMYVDDAMLYQQTSGHVIRSHAWAESLPENQRPTLLQVESLQQAANDVNAIWKFATSDTDIAKLRSFANGIETDLGLACEWSWHDQVDVAQAGNSKGNRLAEYVASRGIDMSEVIAFGDNFNDISMLENVGLGVAMGNSADEVKARAKAVIGGNEETSIADFLKQKVL